MKKAYILGKIFYTLEIIVILLMILFTIFPVGAEAASYPATGLAYDLSRPDSAGPGFYISAYWTPPAPLPAGISPSDLQFKVSLKQPNGSIQTQTVNYSSIVMHGDFGSPGNTTYTCGSGSYASECGTYTYTVTTINTKNGANTVIGTITQSKTIKADGTVSNNAAAPAVQPAAKPAAQPAAPAPVAQPAAPATGTVQAGTDFNTPIHNIGEYMTAFFAWGVPLLGSLAVLMFIYAGYLYMTSQGNQENISTAKEIMTATILGILVLFTAELLLRQVIGTGGL